MEGVLSRGQRSDGRGARGGPGLAEGTRGLTATSSATAPVAAGERLDVLDALRGIAVLGILLVNVDSFSGSGFLTEAQRAALPAGRLDPLVESLVDVFVVGKFYSLFSFLFGVGFAVFIQRASARGADPIRLFKRRLVGLLLIGAIHSLLIWYGDILLTYAVIGFGLIPFIGRDDRAVLRWSAIWLAMPVVLYALLLGIARAAFPGAAPPQDENGLPPMLQTAVESFAHGNYAAIVRANVIMTIGNAVRRLILMFFPRVFGMFLLGFYAGRADVFARLDDHAPLLKRICALGFTIGLPLSFGAVVFGDPNTPRPPSLAGLADTIVESIATPALALAYGAGICLLFRRARGLFLIFAPAGRTALTNYLLHSVAGIAIFYGIGFGWYQHVSFTIAVLGSIVFFALQIVLSGLWLSAALFGPVEWLWRMCTYRRRFALLR